MTIDHGDNLRLRVLVADNYPDSADSLAALLRLWGHEVDVAYNGSAAVHASDEHTYDVIIADLSLPGCSGLSLAEDVRRRFGDRPVLIAVTGLSSQQDRWHAAESGYDHYVVKPGDPEAMRNLLEAVAHVPVG